MKINWEAKLHDVIERHATMEGAWGKSDCFIMAVEAHKAVTGKALLPKLRRYKTEAGGYRLFKKHGFSDVGEALASVLEVQAPLLAKRGELVTVERQGLLSCGVVVAGGIAVKTLYEATDGSTKGQMDIVPASYVKQAFKVI